MLAIAAACVAYFLVPTTYVSTASMVLTTPASGGTLSPNPREAGGLTNPLLQFNDGLRTTAGILILAMNTPETLTRLGIVKNGDTQLTINDGRTNPELLGISTNGPFVYIEVESKVPAKASATVTSAGKLIREALSERQRELKAPPSTYITITDVAPPGTPQAKRTTKWGAAAGGFFAVVIVGLGLAFMVSRIRARRRRAGMMRAQWSAESKKRALAPSDVPVTRDVRDGAQPDRRGSGASGWEDETAVIVVIPDDADGDRHTSLRFASAKDGQGSSGGPKDRIDDVSSTRPRAG
ncbi:hypothetical protein [Planotetraspora phitsanulokensis]|uniref:hypothetical protein n=1 Tax=Planotetraspora phitsanulokensis TaxID=575192 RepID=UPI0019505326|nr:hypothetical protein [Planotetraspora phitsanulokensis]